AELDVAGNGVRRHAAADAAELDVAADRLELRVTRDVLDHDVGGYRLHVGRGIAAVRADAGRDGAAVEPPALRHGCAHAERRVAHHDPEPDAGAVLDHQAVAVELDRDVLQRLFGPAVQGLDGDGRL